MIKGLIEIFKNLPRKRLHKKNLLPSKSTKAHFQCAVVINKFLFFKRLLKEYSQIPIVDNIIFIGSSTILQFFSSKHENVECS